MGKRILLLGLAAAFIVSLNGCASSRNKDLEIQGLRNQVSALESQPAKTEEVITTEEIVVVESSDKSAVGKEGPSVKEIQTALKNAGYYQGAVDGKIGRKSRQAIREFQKANNLSADGVVGKKTWAVLKEYLDKKVK